MNCDRCGKKLQNGHRYRFDVLLREVGDPHPIGQATAMLSISWSGYHSYLCHGITRRVADRIADEYRFNVYELWPEMVDHDLEPQTRPCKECGGRFVAGRSDQVYCGQRCRLLAHNRRRREGARGERHRTLQKAWREANADSYRKHHTRYMRVWRQRQRQERAA